MGQHDEGQQDRESPREKSSSEMVSERTSENLREVRFSDLVFITSVSLGGFWRFWRSSRRPSRRKNILSETLGPVAPHDVAPPSSRQVRQNQHLSSRQASSATCNCLHQGSTGGKERFGPWHWAGWHGRWIWHLLSSKACANPNVQAQARTML